MTNEPLRTRLRYKWPLRLLEERLIVSDPVIAAVVFSVRGKPKFIRGGSVLDPRDHNFGWGVRQRVECSVDDFLEKPDLLSRHYVARVR